MIAPNSRQEFLEGRQHLANDAPVDVPEYLWDGEPWDSFWNSLAEAYAEEGVEIHIHFRAGSVEGRVTGDWCAIFNRTPSQDFDFVGGVVAGGDESKGIGREKDEVGQPMLVHVFKLVEPPKGVRLSTLPTRVRLQPLDNCLSAWIDAPKHVVEFARILLNEDGKPGGAFDVAGHRSSLVTGDGEFKDEVIQGAPEVVEAVSNNKTEFGRRRAEHYDAQNLLRSINIGFGPSSVRAFFDPGSNFGFKAVQVIERSLEPPFVVEGHD
jgi:hypothetical protein